MSTQSPVTEQHSLAIRLLIRLFLLRVKRRFLYWVIVIVVGLIGAIWTARFWTEVLWYDALGYLDVLLTVVRVQVFLVVGLAGAVTTLVLVSMREAVRLSPLDRIISADEKTIDHWRRWLMPFTNPIISVIAVIVGVVFGYAVHDKWDTILLWANQVQWGRTDPYFGRDLSYFMFDLPLLLLVNKVLFWALLVTLVLTVITSYIFGGIRPQAPGSKLPMQVNIHFSILLGLLILVIGWGLMLELHMLSYSEQGVLTGLGFTEANASLVAYQFVAASCVVLFVLFQINIRKPGWILPTVAFIWLMLVGLSMARFYPHLYQLLIVEPQELEREAPYIDNHLEATQYGFGLDGVVRTRAEGGAQRTDLGDAAPAVSALRLWDEDTLWIDYEELQAFRSYYTFPDVDTDRYRIDGQLRQVMLGVRELETDSIPEDARTWQNQHLVYTHGYGVAAGHPAGHTERGLPTFVAQNLPVEGAPALLADNPRVYFGDNELPYSIAPTETPEVDLPAEGSGYVPHHYEGEAGVPVGTIPRRILFALRFWEPRVLLSQLYNDKTTVMWHRQVQERVKLAAPFLSVDHNPYPVVVDGRIKWIVDAYTTSDMMPYSKRVDLGDLTMIDEPPEREGTGGLVPREFIRQSAGIDGVANYIRNSVKVVVDAYDGTVTMYVVDPEDKIIQAWQKVFPESFLPVEQASEDLRAHFRYAQDLFRVQSVVWTDYHMRDAASFYAREASWRIPPDASFIKIRRERSSDEDRLKDLRPSYLFTRYPGEDRDEFAIVQPFLPSDRNVMTGYLVGRSDPWAYGQLTSIEFPPDRTVPGPAQAQARIDQDPRISAWMTLRMQSGSRVSRGDLVVQPFDDDVLYLQPLFVQADKSEVSELLDAQLSSIPQLTKVVAVWGDRVVMRPTLPEVLVALFGSAADVDIPGSPPVDVPTVPDTAGPEPSDDDALDIQPPASDEPPPADRPAPAELRGVQPGIPPDG